MSVNQISCCDTDVRYFNELSTKTIKRLYYYSVAVFVFLQHVKKYYLHLFPAFVSLMYQINKHFFYQGCW